MGGCYAAGAHGNEPFALLLVVGAVSHGGLATLVETSYRVAHTHEVLDDIASLRTAMVDAKTGQRGFLLTADEAGSRAHHPAAGRSLKSGHRPALAKDARAR